ncbi:hypothetical protein [Acidocella facilis]|uniref:hypothetical protein n=1 Tax=Acidocella facilis TaxID=525 RepID=UPI001F1AFFDF|nr:hypothetical protein [Acidocella facilis]
MGSLSEDRRELAEAQKRLADAERELAAVRGIDPWGLIAATSEKLEAAQQALQEAHDDVDVLVARQMGQPVADCRPKSELQAEVARAEAEVEAARKTRVEIERRTSDAETKVRWAKSDVAMAIRRLLEDSPEVAGLVQAIKDAETNLVALYHALNIVGGPTEIRAHDDARLVAKSFTRGATVPDWHMLPGVDSEIITAWRSAVQALQTNANAPLPGGTTPEPRGRKPRLFAA